MTAERTGIRTATGARPRHVLGLAFVAYAFGATMLGTTLPTPLYSLYERQLGFGSLLTTVIYAVYAGGVIAALLLLGRASDMLGRRPMLFAALGCSAASALVFVTDAGLAELFVGRVLSGLSAGIVTGTATVTVVELVRPARRAAATLLATAVNMLGLGCGPLLAGLLAEYAPAPLRLPYLVDLVLLVPAALGLLLTPETVRREPGARFRPQRPAVAAEARAVFAPVAVAAFAAFAVFGLLTSVEPGFLATVLGMDSRAVAGVVVFAMFAGSAVGQIGLARVPTRRALPAGCLVLVAGLAALAVALIDRNLPLMIIGTVVVGAGHGLAFRAGVAAITIASPPEARAATVSSFFVIAYTGISVPVILVGVAAAAYGLRSAGIAFTIAVAALALGALLAVLRLERR